MNAAVYLAARILTVLAVVLPPIDAQNFHRTLGARRRSVVEEKRAQALLYNIRILFGESGLLCELNIYRALYLIETELDEVRLTHCVGGTRRGVLAVFDGFAVDALGYLNGANLYRRYADSLMYADRTAHADRYTAAVLGFESEHLTE